MSSVPSAPNDAVPAHLRRYCFACSLGFPRALMRGVGGAQHYHLKGARNPKDARLTCSMPCFITPNLLRELGDN
jgi:hypothetical protein